MSLGMLGKYERLDILGHGASGIVYLAQDTLLKKRVALKEIDAQGDDLRRVLDEARVLDRLRHPNIVAVHSVDTINGKVVIDMEYVQGSNLLELLRLSDGPLPTPDCVNIAAQICDGLAFAHAHRTVHRDIKPANILVTGNQAVKLVDFGLAQVLGTNSYAGGAGTFAYMAPEDFVEGQQSDRQSDIWATGVILYEMLTGRRPFIVENPRDPFAWSRAIAEETVDVPSFYQNDIPPEMDVICLKALQRNKHLRYADAGQMAADLRAIPGMEQAEYNDAVAVQRVDSIHIEESIPLSPVLMAWSDIDGFLSNATVLWSECSGFLKNRSLQAWLVHIDEPLLAQVAGELADGPDETLDARLREFLYRAGFELEATANADARAAAQLVAKKQYPEAVERLERAVNLDPSRPAYIRLLAQAARGASDIDLAREVLLKGLSHHPNDRSLKRDLAAIGGAPPDLSVTSVDFGTVHHGDQTSAAVTLRAVGTGSVKGRIASAPVWLSITPLTFNSRTRQVLKLDADTESLPTEAREYIEQVVVETTGGIIELPVSLTVVPVQPVFTNIFRWYLPMLAFCLLPAVVSILASLASRYTNHEVLLLPAGLICSGLLSASFVIVTITADLRAMERVIAAAGFLLLPVGTFEIAAQAGQFTTVLQSAMPTSVGTFIICVALIILQIAAFMRFRELFLRWPLWCAAIALVSTLISITFWLTANQ